MNFKKSSVLWGSGTSPSVSPTPSWIRYWRALAMLFSVCNHETWRGFVGGQNNNFLHNLHETNKSLVPSGGNALVLINRKGRRDVSCKSESAWYAQRANQKRPVPHGPWGDLAHFTKPLRFDKQFVQWATNSGLFPSNYWAQR